MPQYLESPNMTEKKVQLVSETTRYKESDNSVSGIGTRNMDASIYQRLHPHTYLQRFLERGVRTDGRKEDDWRGMGINTGPDCLGLCSKARLNQLEQAQ